MDWEDFDSFDDEAARKLAGGGSDRAGFSGSPMLADELAADAGGLRALARESGVGRNSITRLIQGKGCSLSNLAKLTACRPALVVYVDGAPMRLEIAACVQVGGDLAEALERVALDGAQQLGERRCVKTANPTTCTTCGADIAPGEESRVSSYRTPGMDLQTLRECQQCIAGQWQSDAGIGRNQGPQFWGTSRPRRKAK